MPPSRGALNPYISAQMSYKKRLIVHNMLYCNKIRKPTTHWRGKQYKDLK